jgi:hypothetical protein
MMQIDGITACATGIPSTEMRETGRRETISLEPASAYEAVTRQMVLSLSEELREIKGRLNGLIFMVAGSLLLDMALRLAAGR